MQHLALSPLSLRPAITASSKYFSNAIVYCTNETRVSGYYSWLVSPNSSKEDFITYHFRAATAERIGGGQWELG
jgi:hypothetical protein